MSDRDRVQSLLWRAASDGWRNETRVNYDDPMQGATRLVRIVSRTLLARRVRLEFSNGAQVIFDASERRILRFVPPAPLDLPSDLTSLFADAPVTGEDATSAANLLVTLCDGTTGFAYSTQPISGDADPVVTGVSWQSLEHALGVDAQDVPAPDGSLEDFVTALAPHLSAAVLISGDTAAVIRGEGQTADRLMAWAKTGAERLLSPDFPLFGTLETSAMVMFGPPEHGGDPVVLVGRLGEYLVASLDKRSAKTALDLWRREMVGKEQGA